MFYKVKFFLKEYPPPSHCPDASFHSPHPLSSSSLHRHLTWLSVFLAFSLSSPSMGLGAGGMESPHKSRPTCVFATVATQPTGGRHTGSYTASALNCLFPPAEDSVIGIAWKKHLEFCPTPSTSQMWRPEEFLQRDPVSFSDVYILSSHYQPPIWSRRPVSICSIQAQPQSLPWMCGWGSLREAPAPPTSSLSFPRLTFYLGCFAYPSVSLFISKMGIIMRPTSPKGCCGGKTRCCESRA